MVRRTSSVPETVLDAGVTEVPARTKLTVSADTLEAGITIDIRIAARRMRSTSR
jgi:hypothetical protein